MIIFISIPRKLAGGKIRTWKVKFYDYMTEVFLNCFSYYVAQEP